MFQDTNMLNNVIKLLLALPVVILLAHISLRLTNQYLQKQSTGKMIKVIEKVSIDNKSSLCVVKIGKEYMAIGISENNFEIIKELPKEEVEELLDAQGEQINFTEALRMNFKKILKGKNRL